ncbi:PREDICTED: uncharacterized protein C1orf53 homolog isoform X1 [Poecilia mexicana]|uniref:uncharacterized protein C1orf53 homolog isoform X1 n=1 Tax=Poecilia mexicana TaxID=48701 RepID=UPI00072E5628|nr:PREDICTED: uncharacterized protein C1orf53 homolog isoform X1 [Poecilia mexicana]
MFYRKLPGGAFISRSIQLRVQLHKRLVKMSVMKPSEERSSERGRNSCSLQTSEDRSAAAAQRLTEQEVTIHRLHREACEAKKQMYVDPSSGYKVFTEYAHLQRGKCCGSACRHVVIGQEAVSSLDRSPVHHRATQSQSWSTQRDPLRGGRTCKLHVERPVQVSNQDLLPSCRATTLTAAPSCRPDMNILDRLWIMTFTVVNWRPKNLETSLLPFAIC